MGRDRPQKPAERKSEPWQVTCTETKSRGVFNWWEHECFSHRGSSKGKDTIRNDAEVGEEGIFQEPAGPGLAGISGKESLNPVVAGRKVPADLFGNSNPGMTAFSLCHAVMDLPDKRRKGSSGLDSERDLKGYRKVGKGGECIRGEIASQIDRGQHGEHLSFALRDEFGERKKIRRKQDIVYRNAALTGPGFQCSKYSGCNADRTIPGVGPGKRPGRDIPDLLLAPEHYQCLLADILRKKTENAPEGSVMGIFNRSKGRQSRPGTIETGNQAPQRFDTISITDGMVYGDAEEIRV